MSLFYNTNRITEPGGGVGVGHGGNILQLNPAAKTKNIFLDTKPQHDLDNINKKKSKNSQNLGYSSPKELFPIKEAVPRDIIFNNSKPIYFVLRALGIFPFTKVGPGVTQFKILSGAMLYSIVIYCGLLAYVSYVAVDRIAVVISLEGHFEEVVIAYLFVVNLLPVLIVPIAWYETRKIIAVKNNWADFEILYYKTSGRALPLNLASKALILAVLVPISASICVVITHITMVHFEIAQVIPYCFLDTITYMLGAYWYLTCETLSETANILGEDFQRALRHIGPAAMVAEYRALWLRLSKVARDTGSASCYTYTFINLYLFFIITLSIYGLMSQISDGFGIKDVGLAVTACCSICLLFFICDGAHYASYHICTNFQKKLMMVELSWMNTDAQTEINMFLRATEMNPSHINLGGFFDVNRNLFKSLLTTMVTYLVVLLQFQISLPDDPSKILPTANQTLAT